MGGSRSRRRTDRGAGSLTASLDLLGRPLGTIRLSVTDRCNLRCHYCMPEEYYQWLPRDSLLTFAELARVAGIFVSLGATRFRLTGGEPLLRRDLETLVGLLAQVPGIADLAMTTNGVLLARHAEGLQRAGLHRLTVSLDTLQAERMERLTRGGRLADVLAGLAAAEAAGFTGTRINTVVSRGTNDDEIPGIAAFAWERGMEPRFIEYMDVGGATRWDPAQVVSHDEILAVLEMAFGPAIPVVDPTRPGTTGRRYAFGAGRVVGIVASTTRPFCRHCDRARLTADGTLYTCLYAEQGLDLRTPLRAGDSDRAIGRLVGRTWADRADRGAEERAALRDRGALVPLETLRADPRREMHVRGG